MMATRRIEGIKWAQRLDARPACIQPRGRLSGAKRAGLAYERSLAKALGPRVIPAQWWSYEDAHGRGWCQTDMWGHVGGRIVILESKYTWTPAGHEQIEYLYKPVVGRALGFDPGGILGVVVCKRLLPRMASDVVVCASLADALDTASAGRRAVWHHIGGVPQLAAWRAAIDPQMHCAREIMAEKRQLLSDLGHA